MPVIRKRVSDLLAFVLMACGSMLLIACPNSLDGPSTNNSKFGLTVLERSATSLKLQWDPIKEEFPNDEQANRFLDRARREPWSI